MGVSSLPLHAAEPSHKRVVVTQFVGGLTGAAVFRDQKFFAAAQTCFHNFPSEKFEARAARLQKGCLSAFMRRNGAEPQAIAFMEVAPAPAAINEIRAYGPVTVAHADMMWADASDGWAIVGKTGELVPLWTPPDVIDQPPYRAFKRDHPNAMIWTDSITWPCAEALRAAGERLFFDLALRDCRACATLGHAEIAYTFDRNGNLVDENLVRTRTTGR